MNTYSKTIHGVEVKLTQENCDGYNISMWVGNVEVDRFDLNKAVNKDGYITEGANMPWFDLNQAIREGSQS